MGSTTETVVTVIGSCIIIVFLFLLFKYIFIDSHTTSNTAPSTTTTGGLAPPLSPIGVYSANQWPPWISESEGSQLISIIEQVGLFLLGLLAEKLERWGEENNEHAKREREQREENEKERQNRNMNDKESDLNDENKGRKEEKFRENAEERVNEIERQIAENDAGQRELQGERENLQETLEAEKERMRQGVEGAEERVNEIERQIAEKDAGQRLTGETNEKGIESLDSERSKLERSLKDLEEKVKRVQESLSETDATRRLTGETNEKGIESLDSERSKMNKTLKDLEEKVKRVQESLSERDITNRANTAANEKGIETLDSERSKMDKALKDLEEKVKRIEENIGEFQGRRAIARGNTYELRHVNSKTSFRLTTDVVEGQRPRDKVSGVYKTIEEWTTDSPGAAKYILKVASAFGHVATTPFRAFSKTLQIVSDAIHAAELAVENIGSYALKSLLLAPLDKSLADTRPKITAGLEMTSREVGELIEDAMSVMDVLTIFQTFSDAIFGSVFPDAADLVSSAMTADVFFFSIQAQVDALREYNSSTQGLNQGSTNPLPYAQYPVIAGPLDLVGFYTFPLGAPTPETIWAEVANTGLPPIFKGDPYYGQQRVETEIDIIRERILRDSETVSTDGQTTFTQMMQANLTGNQYNTVISDPTDLLLNYTYGSFGALTAKDQDYLYGLAYSKVCSYYGGIMYVDKFTDTGPYSGRLRFQCGWTQDYCAVWSNTWSTQTDDSMVGIVGNYAEWYDLSNVKTTVDTANAGSDVNRFIFSTDPANPNAKLDITQSITQFSSGVSPFHAPGTGACILTNSGIRSLCQTSGGDYDLTNHACNFTPQYCQSIGTCYNQSTQTCTLAPVQQALHGVSFLFGTGGPRDWIRRYGCSFPSDPTKAFELTTTGGFMIISDMLAVSDVSKKRGIEAAMTDPLTIEIMVATIAANFSEIPGVDDLAILAMIAAGATAGIEAGIANVNEYNGSPSFTDFPNEYAIGGWYTRTDGTIIAPKAVALLSGWVTKPIRVHGAGPYLVNPTTGTTQSPISQMHEFPNSFKSYYTNNHDITACDIGAFLGAVSQNYGGGDDCDGLLCSKFSPPMIRGGGNAGDNQGLYCIPPFPKNTFVDTTYIGQLMTGDTAELVSNVWTDGQTPGYPTYPTNQAGSDACSSWYYQYVYDPDKMVGYDPGTCTTNQATGAMNCSSPVTLPTYLWNDTILRTYFTDSTISSMRQYYCNKLLKSDLTGNSMNPKCWGFLSIDTTQFQVFPMTVLATTNQAITNCSQGYSMINGICIPNVTPIGCQQPCVRDGDCPGLAGGSLCVNQCCT